jgi:hypothetical protein
VIIKTFSLIFSDAEITRKCVILNKKSEGLSLSDAYAAYTKSCILHKRNPISYLLFARLLHDLFPSLRCKRVKTGHLG